MSFDSDGLWSNSDEHEEEKRFSALGKFSSPDVRTYYIKVTPRNNHAHSCDMAVWHDHSDVIRGKRNKCHSKVPNPIFADFDY